MRLFADDSSLFYSASNIHGIERIINQILIAWAKRWLINFNPAKTETELFTLK